jgi:hypothetical protein
MRKGGGGKRQQLEPSLKALASRGQVEHEGSGVWGVEVKSGLENLASKGKQGFEVKDLESLRGVEGSEGKQGVVEVNDLEALKGAGSDSAKSWDGA